MAEESTPPSSEGRASRAVSSTRARRTVSGRLLVSFVVVFAAFGVTVAWSLSALRAASRDARLVRDAYVPLMLTLGEALSGQNVMNAQLNHVTEAKNPADARQWMETARRVRPLLFAKLREEAVTGLSTSDPLRGRVVAEVDALEGALRQGHDDFVALFGALEARDGAKAETLRDRVIVVETDAARRLRALRAAVDSEMTTLIDAAQHRERRSFLLLVGLCGFTLFVGAATIVYARRVLAPLSRVTSRARAVAGGDLTPHETVATDDEIGELAATFEDMVAAIRRARSELVRAERLATIGKMAAHITHEVRNPLSSIGLNLELLEEELASPASSEEATQLLKAIQREVDRLSRIAEQYLSAVREPRLQLAREQVDDVLRETHAFVQVELRRAGLVSSVEVDGDIPPVELDEDQFRQAIVNLVRNAREALDEGGRIWLRARANDGAVEVEVEDDGPGIPDDVRPTLFDPFTTTKRHGTGLGLAVTRSIIEAHGGSIDCKPRNAGGTRFVIRLPTERFSG